MNFEIRPREVTLGELQECVADALARLGLGPRDVHPDTHCYLFAMWNNDVCTILDWGLGTLAGSGERPTPFHEWLRTRSGLEFWDIAFGWQLYKLASLLGAEWLGRWPAILDQPLPSDRMLGFLDLSKGYLVWDFQLEMMFGLGGLTAKEGREARKDWNGKRPAAHDLANALALPDGRRFADVLESRLLLPGRLAFPVPSRVVGVILRSAYG